MREPCALPPTGPPCGPRTGDILGEGGGGMTPDDNSKGWGDVDVVSVESKKGLIIMRKIMIIPLDKKTVFVETMTCSKYLG